MYNNFGNIQGAIDRDREEMNRSVGADAYLNFEGLMNMAASHYGQGGAGTFVPSIDIPDDDGYGRTLTDAEKVKYRNAGILPVPNPAS